MSMFLSKALRRAEVFLEQVDESVAQASRRLVVEGAVGDVDDAEDDLHSEDDTSSQPFSRASSIPRAELPPPPPLQQQSSEQPQSQPPINTTQSPPNADIPQAVLAQDLEADADAQSDSYQNIPDALDDGIDDSVLSETSTPARVPPPAMLTVSSTPTGAPTIESPVASSLDPSMSIEEPSPAPAVQPSTSEISVASSAALTARSPSEAMISIPEAPDRSISSEPTATTATVPRATPSVDTVAPSAVSDDYVSALQEENVALRKELESVEDSFENARRERSKVVKNLKRMKEIVSEMDESLQEKSTEAREAQDELEKVRDELNALRSASLEQDARGKDTLDTVRKQLSAEITTLETRASSAEREAETLREENDRLREAMLQGHEVDLATADGAREEATQAHRAYETETLAHRETRKQAKEREEKLQEEAALAAVALAAAQRKAEEAAVGQANARSLQRTAENKLGTVSSARDAAFARIEDLEAALRMYDGDDGEAPGQREAKAMQQTVSELENALEAKNVELNRLEGEVEALRSSAKRGGLGSPRAPGVAGRGENGAVVDVEVKLRHMADSSLRKQAQLEVLRSENRALQQQLTTERKRTREAQAMAAAASSSRQSIRGGFRGLLDPGESERGDRMYGVRDGPLARFRAPRSWPRPVATFLTGMDRMSAQALAFLRKEPLLRIVIVLYLAMMHLFVYSLLHWHVDAVAGGRVSGGKPIVGAGVVAAAASAAKHVTQAAAKAK